MKVTQLAICIAVSLVAVSGRALAVPAGVNYQGRLMSGTNLVNGTKTILVRVYDNAWPGGTLLYMETNSNVVVNDGLYRMTIGDEPGFANILTNDALYLELVVDAQVLLPREKLDSVPYAMLADAVGNENDPIYSASPAAGISNSQITNWNTAYGWGNHATQGYLTSESDPLFSASPASGISGSQIGNWNTAYGWGNHAGQGYLTAETDPIYTNDKTSIVFDGDTAGGDLFGTYPGPAIRSNVIVDADVNTSANIQGTKIQAGSTTLRGTVQFAAGAGVVAPYRAVDDNDDRLNGYDQVNTLQATVPNSRFNITAGKRVTVSNISPNTVKIGLDDLDLDNTIWVATNGTPNGPGTIDRPYGTVQAGYNAAATLYPTAPATLVIAAGDYPGPLMMGAGNVHVQGLARPVLAQLSVSAPASVFLPGKQRVQGIVVREPAQVMMGAGGVKFHNCRFNAGMDCQGDNVEFQDCHFTQPGREALSPASLLIGVGPDMTISNIGVYNSAVQWPTITVPSQGALTIRDCVERLEIIGCEIVSLHDMTPAVFDGQAIAPELPGTVHLYAHNYIKGPASAGESGGATPAVLDTAPNTIAFHFNVVYGDLGVQGNTQYTSHNMVYGIYNWGPAPGYWRQRPFMNVEYQTTNTVALPDAWDD